ncbi:MAG: DNA-processing protein DprA [Desulfobacterales bacterium]|nr:MAG: DNA-processing protein DprA [Desulfobacterales bacterium]
MDKLLPWFHLKSVPGIGNLLFKRLIDHFESPERIFQTTPADLLRVEGLSPRLAAAILQHKMPENIQKEIDLVRQKGYQIVTLLASDYPPLLRKIADPPPYLYVHGKLDPAAHNIAVVGSRHATAYGILTTKRLCADLAARNITVVSGMARGIDTAAHEGALLGQGPTVAVLGSGFDRIYPAENHRLLQRIAENGAVISEFPLATKPEAHNFPVRNRIISGMSLGAVVVEATRKSGSLITARLAVEQNREVFAVPGSIQSFKSTGTHTLIKQGAKLVEHAQDILDELSPALQASLPVLPENPTDTRKTPSSLSADEALIYEALSPYPIHIDDLGRKTGMDSGRLCGLLLQLELKGIVQQTAGKLFSIVVKQIG